MRRSATFTAPRMAYGCALLATACATVVSLPFASFFAQDPFTPFYLAVAVTAWYGGLGAGLVSVFGGAIAADSFLLPPQRHFAFGSADAWVRSLLFIAIACVITMLITAAQRRHSTVSPPSERATGDRGERSVAERGLPLRLLDLRTHLTVATLAAAQLRRRHVSTIAAARLCVYLMRAHAQMLDDIQALEAEFGEDDHRHDPLP